jgi:hypothetical protein
MKLALLFLTSAALLSWASFEFDRRGVDEAVVAAERRQEPAAQSAPSQPAGLTIRDVSQPNPMASLFRPAITPEALRAPQPGQTFRLIGIAGGDSSRIALLRDDADQQTIRARVGDEVRGWRLESLDARCALLVQSRRRQTACLT